MKSRSSYAGVMIVLAMAGLVLLNGPDAKAAEEGIRFNGDFEMQANGDADVLLRFQMPMQEYQNLRDNISNLYLLLRELASSRSDAEVVDKKAEHDDANRSVTFTMKMLGAAHNRGDHWEFPVEEGLDFSNLDNAVRTLYFNEIAETIGGTMRGAYKLKLPAGATDIEWNESQRLVSYVMPPVQQAGGGSSLWLLGMACLLGGAGATMASFFI